MLTFASSVVGLTIDLRLVCEVDNSCTADSFFTIYPDALDTLRFAARAFEPFADNLSAIPASPSWLATFKNPDTGSAAFGIRDLEVPADTVIIYVGGRDLASNQIGEAGPGAPLRAFERGQGTIVGTNATDFATWGGSIAFDTTPPLNGWHFEIETNPAPGEIDFLSVALHEIAHVFGFGIDRVYSFSNLLSGQQFTGAASTAIYGGPVPMTSDLQHWANGTTSPPFDAEPDTALDRTVIAGRRTGMTPLDYAALKDIGWEVPDQLLGLLGDSDGDLDVDGADFLAWQRGFGATGIGGLQGDINGDINGDATADDYDLWLWRNYFGATATDPPVSQKIPEPSTLGLVAGMILGLSGRRCGSRLCCGTV